MIVFWGVSLKHTICVMPMQNVSMQKKLAKSRKPSFASASCICNYLILSYLQFKLLSPSQKLRRIQKSCVRKAQKCPEMRLSFCDFLLKKSYFYEFSILRYIEHKLSKYIKILSKRARSRDLAHILAYFWNDIWHFDTKTWQRLKSWERLSSLNCIGATVRDCIRSLSLAFSRLNVIAIASNRIFYNRIRDYHAIGRDCMRLDAIACASNTIACEGNARHAIAAIAMRLLRFLRDLMRYDAHMHYKYIYIKFIILLL